MSDENNTISFAKDEISLDEKLSNLPTLPGVYQFKDREGTRLYVGKAKNLRNRVRQYFHKSHVLEPRIASMVEKVFNVEIITTDSEVEALILEANLIKSHKPRYNVNLKDDKSYPYIVITHEPFPRVFVTRRIYRDGSRYFGPYTDVHTMRSALKTVRDIFMIRSCNYHIDQDFIDKKKVRVCLDYHIKKCEGPCEGLVTEERYGQMIEHVAQVLRGKTASVIGALDGQMKSAADALRFEDAAVFRNRMRELEVYSSKQKVVDIELHDRDIIAVAADGDDACGVVFKIREGKVLGRQHYYLNKVDGKTESEVVEALVERYYLESNDVPSEVVLSAEIESSAATQEWLSRQRGKPVEVKIPGGGELGKLVAMSRKNAQYLLDELKLQKMKRDDFVPHAVKSLQRDLRLPHLPQRIECFDISHLQGTETVASMVVFENGKAKKSDYRKFKIRTTAAETLVDDFASMREVIRRRYTRVMQEQSEMPDLIVVDGGKGQLSSACSVLHDLSLDAQPIVSLAKRLEEVFVPNESDPIPIPKSSSSLRLLQQIRDEAHRFAITFHRSLRDKRTLQTELDLIEGIGKKRAKELLEAFGSVQGVKFATDAQLSEIVGEKVAGKIREYFEEPVKEEGV
ncbi:MAG TPA: excinuclease ABC subunit UvrC [Bacteroidota bacterium]|nr:excinuclease ABC subunit UvrC [Bacteroidota bacterium]